MKKNFKNLIIIVVSLVVLLYVLAPSLSQKAPAQGRPPGRGGPPQSVMVVNQPSDPVPIQGDVEVTNALDVNVTNIPTVEVVNTDPVPVIIMNDGRQPFQNTLLIIIDNGEWGEKVEFNVPEGKRLIIKHAAIEARIPFGQKVVAVLGAGQIVEGQLQLAATRFPFAVVAGFVGIGDLWVADVQTLMFADDQAYPPPWWSIVRDSNSGIARIEASVSGYLEDR